MQQTDLWFPYHSYFCDSCYTWCCTWNYFYSGTLFANNHVNILKLAYYFKFLPTNFYLAWKSFFIVSHEFAISALIFMPYLNYVSSRFFTRWISSSFLPARSSMSSTKWSFMMLQLLMLNVPWYFLRALLIHDTFKEVKKQRRQKIALTPVVWNHLPMESWKCFLII